MPITEYEIDPEDGPKVNLIRVWIETKRGEPSNFAVPYETMLGEQRVPVVRYDAAHGRSHRDTLDRRGRTIHKRYLPDDWTNKEAINRAIKDLRDNWRNYRERFLRSDA